MKIRRFSPFISTLLISAAAMILTCSDHNPSGGNPNAVEFDLSLKFASSEHQSLTEIVTTYRVLAIADDNTYISYFDYANGNITGLIEYLSAGPGRTITVEGLAVDGTIIFSGSAVITIVAGEKVKAEIIMSVVAKLVRVSPHIVGSFFGDKIAGTVKMDNFKGATAAKFSLYYNSSYVYMDSIQAGSGLPEGVNFSYDFKTVGNIPLGEIEFTLSHSTPFVDSSGNASIAKIFFGFVYSQKCFDSGEFALNVVSVAAPGVELEDIYVADGKVNITRGRLVLSDDTVKFGLGVSGLNLNAKRIDISDSCGSEIDYVISTEESWIEVDSALTGNTPVGIFIKVDTVGLSSGKYEGRVIVSSTQVTNPPQEVVVKLDYDLGLRNLQVSPGLIYFFADENGAVPATRRIHVEDAYGYNIEFTAEEDIPWLSINKTSGTSPDSILANITTTALEPGTYTDTILITSPGAINSPKSVTIVYIIASSARILEANPGNIHFAVQQNGSLPAQQTFMIFETGKHSIPYAALETITWLSISGVSGITPDTVTVSVITTNKSPGLYLDSIWIGSDEADNSPIYLFVSLGITVGPRTIEVEPDTLKFAYTPFIDSTLVNQLKISEASGFHIPFGAFENISWISLSHESGTTEDSIIVTANPGLPPGFYVDSIEISAPAVNSPAFVVVTFEVNEINASLETNPDSIHLEYVQYSDALPTAQFTVYESHGYSNPYNAIENIDWIFLSDTMGMTPKTITAYFKNTGLEPGIYVDSIMIASSDAANSPIYVKISLEVIYFPPPALHVVPDTLYFTSSANGNLPDSQVFDVYFNNYPTPIIVTDSIVWLFVTYDTGFVGSDVTVFISTTNLAPGVYFDSILVSTSGPDYAPAYEYVQYKVDSPAVSSTISGVIRDSGNIFLYGVQIVAYDNYPNGSILGSTFTDSNGVFNFFDINGSIEIRASKDGYYPQNVTVMAPDSSVLISLWAVSAFVPSNEWVDLYCNSLYYLGNLVQPNDVVEAFDPESVLCGRFVVAIEGVYGFLQVYRDESGTAGIDEGCVTGDNITLKVNGLVLLTDMVAVYPPAYESIEACYKIAGGDRK